MLAGLAYDGLVAYRRVAGVAGATLVGGLATRPRSRARDGRTYVFTLRRGIRYSDGTPVRPGDFRASMERYLRAARDATSRPTSPGIVGARRCISGAARCDLSRGIESDARARTITVHLTAPDPEFLHKLTMPVRLRRARRHARARGRPAFAPPGTGPYRIAAGTCAAAACSSATRASARPPRGPPVSRIGSRSRSPRSDVVETHIAAVERGTADLTWLMDFPLRGHLPDLVARAPGRLHSTPAPVASWMFLNVRRPPFDDPRVRRAINFATDRAELVDLYGGPQAAAPTCQIVPPAFPGFSSYCPYTANPVARRRVDRAGPRARAPPGRRVRPGRHARDRGRRRGRAPARRPLLRVAAARPRLPCAAARDARRRRLLPGDRAARAHARRWGWYGWGADYLSASTMLEPRRSACTPSGDAKTENVSHLCAARLDAAIERARAAAAEDAPAAWAAVDRRVVDLAAAVPYVNPRVIAFASKRVGNVISHPMYQTLLDQTWVR